MKVEDIFSFSNNSTVFFCTEVPKESFTFPKTFKVCASGIILGEIEFDSFRMPTQQVIEKGGISLSTSDSLSNIDELKDSIKKSSLYLLPC